MGNKTSAERSFGAQILGRAFLFLAIAFGPLYAANAQSLLPEANSWQTRPSLLLAQADYDDAYDPFADYSEFEESMEEEEDINFFRNGRLLTIGFLVGNRGWTDTLNKIFTSSPTFGLFLAYFFDLRFAMQIGYMTSDHMVHVPKTDVSDPINGAINISDISFNFKYFLNTQNVTRGLADLNPYLIAGFSQIYRSYTFSGTNVTSKDGAFAFNVGGGIEIPIMRNRMYFGVQGMYQLVNFPDEGREMVDEHDKRTGFFPRGDSWNVIGVLGTNF